MKRVISNLLTHYCERLPLKMIRVNIEIEQSYKIQGTTPLPIVLIGTDYLLRQL